MAQNPVCSPGNRHRRTANSATASIPASTQCKPPISSAQASHHPAASNSAYAANCPAASRHHAAVTARVYGTIPARNRRFTRRAICVTTASCPRVKLRPNKTKIAA